MTMISAVNVESTIKLNDVDWSVFVDRHSMSICNNPNPKKIESVEFDNYYLYVGAYDSAYVYAVHDNSTIVVLFETRFVYSSMSLRREDVRRLNIHVHYRLTREEMIDLYYTSMAYSI